MKTKMIMKYAIIALVIALFFGVFLVDTLVSRYNGGMTGLFHQDCSGTVILLISILLGLSLYLYYQLISSWYVFRRDGKLFARDMEEIFKLSNKNEIDIQEAEEQYLKWCYDRGVRTFRKYVPKPCEDMHRYNKRQCVIDNERFCETPCSTVDDGTKIGSSKCQQCKDFVRISEDKTYVICKAK